MTRANDMCLFDFVLFLAASATVLTSFTQGHVLEFTVEPTDTVVESGQSAVLDCVVKAAQHQSSVLIQWMDKDASTLNFLGDTYRSQLTNGSLYISNITEEQRLTGTYQCVAELPNIGKIISRTATLSIAKLHGFFEEPKNITVYLGQKAHFSCSANASPPTRIRWFKDDRPLQIDELRMTVLPSGALEIDEVQEPDQGWYRCNVTGYNSHIASSLAYLTINGDQDKAAQTAPPIFIATPRSAVVIEGQNISLDCAANANPNPSINWLKDGYNIDMNDLDSRFSLVGSTNSLRITKIKEEDAGTYQCRATNREDSFDESAIIQVQVPPRFLTKPLDKIEHVSNNVELQCNVFGKPEPKIQWFRNGESIGHSEYYNIVNGHNLKITGLLSEDSGIFQCFATNPAGNIQAAASLRVISNTDKRKPQKIKQKKARPQLDEQQILTKKQQSKSIFNNLKADFPSDAEDHDFGLLPSKYDPHRAFSSLKSSSDPQDSQDLGSFGTAFSSPTILTRPRAGNAEKKIIDGLPGAPQDLKALIVKARFIILGWHQPAENSDDIQAYSVFYKQEGSERERVQNTTRSKLEEISVQNLLPGKVYHFRVVAYNQKGAGISSKHLTVTTQSEENVATAPQKLDVYATGARSVHISWEPPQNPNGRIIKYIAYYMTTAPEPLEHNVDTGDTSFDLTGLLPYTEYSIWVVAVNNNGPGAATEELLVRTFGDVPSEPPNNVTLEPTSTSILIRWEPPPLESQNGVILGYKIKYRKEGKKPTNIQTEANVRMYTLSDLERGVKYSIRIWALNLNGSSPPTDWYDTITYENDIREDKVPEKPANIRVKPMSDVIYVLWSPPLKQNTRIRNYVLGWGKGIPDMYSMELHESNRTYAIKNLDPNSEYVLSIRASNQMGTGPPIYTTVRTQEEQPPEPAQALMPPIGLKAHVITPQTVVLYWSDPTLKYQFVRDNRVYVIKYTDEKSSKNRYENTTDLNYMINDLKPNTNYEFSVKLVKGSKESPWSMVVSNKTFELPPNVPPRDLDIHFKDEESQLVELSWQPPKISNGRITGYVILFTENKTKNDREWQALAVKGDNHSSVIYDLKPFTQYYFKVQARNSRGYGPFSNVVTFRTGQNVASISIHQNSDSQILFSKSFLLYLLGVGCFVAVATVAGVVIFLCCRKKDPATTSPDRSKKGYQKGTQNIKPPDLWIHHDQMELKAMEKRHSNNDGASSSGAMTLPRSVAGNDYDTHDHINTNSLDKRTYVSSNYGGSTSTDHSLKRVIKPKSIIQLPVDSKPPREPIATPINTATLSQSSSDSTPSSRPSYQRTGYSMPRTMMSNDAHLSNTPPPMENLYSAHPGHTTYDNATSSSGYICQPTIQHAPPGSTYAPGMNILAEQAAKRAQGQGHPLKSFTVPAPPPISAPGTPQAKHIVRPNSSPFKKAPATSGSTSTLTGTPPSRICANNPPPHTPEEVQRLHSSHSTEELNQEMANLEGLMLTLNAITANEFEC